MNRIGDPSQPYNTTKQSLNVSFNKATDKVIEREKGEFTDARGGGGGGAAFNSGGAAEEDEPRAVGLGGGHGGESVAAPGGGSVVVGIPE